MHHSSYLHVISQLPIPFDDIGRFAPDKLSGILSTQKATTPDALIVGAALIEQSDREIQFRKLLFQHVAEQAAATRWLIADVNASTPEAAAELTRTAHELGFGAISLCLSVATAEGMFSGRTFIRAVTAASTLPVYVRIFDRPSANETLDQFASLIQHARIAGVLVYCRDSEMLRRLRDHSAGAVTYCGLEESLMAHLAFGATGVVSHLAYFLSPLFREIQAAVARDDLYRAINLQKLAEGFVAVASGMGVLAATKGWLTLLGVDCGPCRGMNGCLTHNEWRMLAVWLEGYLHHASTPTPAVGV